MSTTNYRARVKAPEIQGWTWKQVVMGAAIYIGGSIRELADVYAQANGVRERADALHGRQGD